MRSLRVGLLFALLVSSTACFNMTTVLKVNGDGAGTIDHSMVFTNAALAQLKQLALFSGGRGKPFDPLSEQQARDIATAIGEGVTYVSSTPVVTPNGQGRAATYAFADVNQLKISTQPAAPQGVSAAALGGNESVTFSLTRDPGSPNAMLHIHVPEPNWIGSIGTLNASGQLATLKTLLGGAKILLAVEPAGALVRTSSPYVDGQRVTLLEVDLDEILKDDTLVPRLTAAKTQDEVMAIMRTAAGLKINLDREITIEFTPVR